MADSLTLDRAAGRRLATFLAGAGMIAASFLTIQHFFAANFPDSIFKGSFCDISAFFNCNGSAFSSIAHFRGVPMGCLGLVLGVLVCLGALFPSQAPSSGRRRPSPSSTPSGVLALLGYSLFVLKSLCLLCAGYYLFSLFSRLPVLEVRRRAGSRFPSLKMLPVIGPWSLWPAPTAFSFSTPPSRTPRSGGVSARGRSRNTTASKNPRSELHLALHDRPVHRPLRGRAHPGHRIRRLPLPRLPVHVRAAQPAEDGVRRARSTSPSSSSPWRPSATRSWRRTATPGACDLSYIAAKDPASFLAIYNEIFSHFEEAKDPQWRVDLARKYGVESALTDPGVKDLVGRIIATGAEYEKTSDQYAHGIRSTPTLIVNNRMIIGTLPYAQLRAIFEALLAESGKTGDKRFLENWVGVPAEKEEVRAGRSGRFAEADRELVIRH